MADEDKKSYSKVSLYEVDEDKVVRTRRTCPECGPGVFLAKHKDRESCGRCGYTEFTQPREPKGKAAKAADDEGSDEDADKDDSDE